jgi:hypothetical protein
MAKLFTHIGAAVYNGVDKFRFTDGRADIREKTMTKEGFTNIVFVELPHKMTKEEAFLTEQARTLSVERSLSIPTKKTTASKAENVESTADAENVEPTTDAENVESTADAENVEPTTDAEAVTELVAA